MGDAEYDRALQPPRGLLEIVARLEPQGQRIGAPEDNVEFGRNLVLTLEWANQPAASWVVNSGETALSDLRLLFQRLVQDGLPDGRYRIYLRETGFPLRLLIEFNKSGAATVEAGPRVVIRPRVLRGDSPLADSQADYELLAPLGQGGMGVVLAARQASIKRTVAVKMLASQKAEDTAAASNSRLSPRKERSWQVDSAQRAFCSRSEQRLWGCRYHSSDSRNRKLCGICSKTVGDSSSMK